MATLYIQFYKAELALCRGGGVHRYFGWGFGTQYLHPLPCFRSKYVVYCLIPDLTNGRKIEISFQPRRVQNCRPHKCIYSLQLSWSTPPPPPSSSTLSAWAVVLKKLIYFFLLTFLGESKHRPNPTVSNSQKIYEFILFAKQRGTKS